MHAHPTWRAGRGEGGESKRDLGGRLLEATDIATTHNNSEIDQFPCDAFASRPQTHGVLNVAIDALVLISITFTAFSAWLLDLLSCGDPMTPRAVWAGVTPGIWPNARCHGAGVVAIYEQPPSLSTVGMEIANRFFNRQFMEVLQADSVSLFQQGSIPARKHRHRALPRR